MANAESIAAGKSFTERDEHVIVVTNVQPDLRADGQTPAEATAAVVELMRRASAERSEDGATPIDLFVLPELCPVGYSEDTFAKYLPNTPQVQTIYKDIEKTLADVAKELQCHICYGTIGWEQKEAEDEASSKDEIDMFIRQVVVDQTGSIVATYDKIHICDYGDCAETRFFQRGSTLTSFSIRGFKFGIIICADMRYPVLAHRLVKDHCIDVLLHPACFMRDISFATWKAFRTTRAVECGVYMTSGNYAGEYFGEAAILPPWIDETHTERALGKEMGYLTESMSRTVLDRARGMVPFHRHAQEGTCACCGTV